MSAGAIALASQGLSIDSNIGVLDGWSWVSDLIVAPHYTSSREEDLRAAVSDRPGSVGIGLPEHAALALGPNGEQEVWGEQGVSVVSR
jgi:hypothetical protein